MNFHYDSMYIVSAFTIAIDHSSTLTREKSKEELSNVCLGFGIRRRTTLALSSVVGSSLTVVVYRIGIIK